MESKELFGEAEKKRVIEAACGRLLGRDREECIRILGKRPKKDPEKQISDEKK